MRKLIFIASIIAMVGFSITSCNKENEDVLNSKNTYLKTGDFDPVEYVENLKEEHRASLDAFAADGFYLKFDDFDDKKDITEIKPILSLAENPSGGGFFDWIESVINKALKICNGYSSDDEEFIELMQDCNLCKWHYIGCPNATKIHFVATEIFQHSWNLYLEKESGIVDPSVKQMVYTTLWDTAYAKARVYIIDKYCDCD